MYDFGFNKEKAQEFNNRLLDFGFDSEVVRDFRGHYAIKTTIEGQQFINALLD
jgi:hypothetical protein